MENSFSLLGDVEIDDVSTFLERLATEAKKVKEKQQKRNSQSVTTQGGRGPGGQGGGSRRYRRNDDQQFRIGYGNGYQLDDRGFHGYQQNNGGVNGHSNETVDGYRKNNGRSNSYQQRYGRWNCVSRGRGRGPFRSQNGYNGIENESQIVEGNQQVESQVQGGDTGGVWEKVIGKQHGNGSSSYGDGRRQSGGGRFRGRGGRINGYGYVAHNSRAKEAPGSSGNRSINGDNDIGNIAAAAEVSKDVVQEETAEESRIKTKEEEESRIKTKEEEEKEARRKAWLEGQKEEAKKLTLKQYQNQLLEKRKALEDMKPEERKATLDKDFESMHLVGKKKEDVLFIKQDSDNGKLKKKDDKIHKSVIIAEFLKPAEAEYGKRSGFQGRGGGGFQRGALSRQASDSATKNTFPHTAEGKDCFVNSDRNRGGGRGGSTRGSSADPSIVGAPSKKPVKPLVPVPSFDDSVQFPDLGRIVKY